MVFQHKHGVYQIRNLQNNKCYIGSAASPKGFSHRWGIHRRDLNKSQHHSTALQNAWNKYGATAFVFEILLYCDPENCLTYEQTYLDTYQPEYNICKIAGSWLGMHHSEAAKAKISQSRKGKYKGYKNPFWGKRHTSEARRQMSISSQGQLVGCKNPHAKLTTEQVLLVKSKLVDGISCSDVASELQVSKRIITRIASGETWGHL
jgi:group I intron endonuclease